MKLTKVLSKHEYRWVRLLRALANENRFIIFKTLQKNPQYATELNTALGISRPALGKHVRILIREGLVEQKYVFEKGTAKAVYELTVFGTKIAEGMKEFMENVEDISKEVVKTYRGELMDVNAQISSTYSILKGLEKKMKNKEISFQDYRTLKADYEKKINLLQKRRNKLKGMVKE